MHNDANTKPTIKGIFANSHVSAVKKLKGDAGLKLLKERFGKDIPFKNNESVSIEDEVRLLDLALEIVSDGKIPESEINFESGRLHFRNFTLTPLAKILFSLFRHNIRTPLLHGKNIAGHVFRGVKFYAEEMSAKKIKVNIENSHYPIEHFRGFLFEWIHYSKHTGTVTGSKLKTDHFEYIVEWN